MLDRLNSGVDLLTDPHDGEPSWQPLKLDEIAPRLAEAVSLLRARRSLPELRLAGHPLRIAMPWLPKAPEIGAPWCVTALVDGASAELILPQALLDIIFRSTDPSIVTEGLRSDHAGLLLEFALSDALKEIEDALGWSVALTSVAQASGQRGSAREAAIPISLQLQGAGSFSCQLRLDPAYLLMLARHLDKIAGPPAWRMHLPLRGHLRWAVAELTVAELRGLAPGDIILPDHSCGHPESAVAVFCEHLAAPVELSQSGCRFGDRVRLARGSGWEWAIDGDEVAGAEVYEGTTNDVPVRLFFELGQVEADCSALPQSGAVIPLPRSSGGGVDIVIDGARVGRGQIITIGDATGIRVTRL